MSAATKEMMARKGGFVVADRGYQSRLLVGMGKYEDFDETASTIDGAFF